MNFLFNEHRGWLHTPWIVWIAAGVFVLGWSIAGWWMFEHWLYQGYDLAIFDQVVWNTAHGRWFEYSFNPHSYLGDHREWVLVLLAPLYWVVPHPVTLLVVQALAVSFTVVPLYRIAVRAWRSAVPVAHAWYGRAMWAGLGVVVLFLVHPSVHGVLIYEFHALTLTLPLVCWLWDAVQRGRLGQMWVWATLLLLIRDDVALVVVGVGVLLWCIRELPLRRRVVHGVGLIVVALVWFQFNQWVGRVMHPDAVSKFFVFFQWMGDTPLEIMWFAVQHPLQVLSMLFQYDHIIAPLFFVASVGGLVLLRPRLLLPALFPLTLLFIDRPVGLTIVKFHYSAFVIPWLLMAAAEGLGAVARWAAQRPAQWVTRTGGLSTVLCLVSAVVIFQSAVLSPFQDVWVKYRSLSPDTDASYEHALSFVGPNDAVMASQSLYARLSHRDQLYPTLHAHTGLQHYSTLPYIPPAQVDWLLLETQELLTVETMLSEERREGMGQRFQHSIDSNGLVLRYESPEVIVYGPSIKHVDGVAQQLPLTNRIQPQDVQPVSVAANDDIRVTGWVYEPHFVNGSAFTDGDVDTSADTIAGTVWLTMERVSPRRVSAQNIHASIEWRDDDGVVVGTQLAPIGRGVNPTTEWQYGDPSRTIAIPVRLPSSTARELTVSVGPMVEQPTAPFVTLTQTYRMDPDERVVIGTMNVQ